MTKEELKLKAEELREASRKIMDEYLDSGKTWDEYKENPTVREYWKTVAEYRLVQDYTLHPIKDGYGNHMSLEEFKDLAGVFFSDYDGIGYSARISGVSVPRYQVRERMEKCLR